MTRAARRNLGWRLALACLLALPAVGLPSPWVGPVKAGSIVIEIDYPTPGGTIASTEALAGWAVDRISVITPGISQVDVYLDGDATTGRLLGTADYGGDRPDVLDLIGYAAYRYSGFTFSLAEIAIEPGPHAFTVVVLSVATGSAGATVVDVTVTPAVR